MATTNALQSLRFTWTKISHGEDSVQHVYYLGYHWSCVQSEMDSKLIGEEDFEHVMGLSIRDFQMQLGWYLNYKENKEV